MCNLDMWNGEGSPYATTTTTKTNTSSSKKSPMTRDELLLPFVEQVHHLRKYFLSEGERAIAYMESTVVIVIVIFIS